MKTTEYLSLFAHPDSKQMIRKAFTSATGSGEALIPEHLERVVTNIIVRLVPELAIPVYKYDRQKNHEFNRVTALPAAGSAMGESSVTPIRSPSTTRASVEMKIFKRKASITGFLQDTTEGEYNAVDIDLETQLQAFGSDLVSYMLYGNAGADQYQFNGLDYMIATSRTNTAYGGDVPANMNFLHNMITASNRRGGNKHRRAFIMSPEMLQFASSLWTNVRDQRQAVRDGTTTVQIDGGYVLQRFMDIPILESTQTRPQAQMGAVSVAHAGAGSAIPDDTRYFQVAPVTWNGEEIASTEVSDTSSSSDTITLSWTAYTGALLYKIYASDASGAETLVDIIAANTYDGNGTISAAVTSHIFTSEPLTPDSTTVPTHMQSDVPLNYSTGTPMETIFLWDLDEYQGCGKMAYTNRGGSRLEGLVSIEPLAKTDDADNFLLKTYTALIDAYEGTCAMYRGARIA